MIVGAYHLHLYCQTCNRLGEPSTGTAQTLREAWAQMRDMGWKKVANDALCPFCVKARKNPKPVTQPR